MPHIDMLMSRRIQDLKSKMTQQKKKKKDVQQQLHWGKFVSQREVGKLKRQENLCLNDFPPKKKKKNCMLIMMH